MDYIKIISVPGTDKRATVDAIQKKYDCASWDAAYSQLKRAIKQRKEQYGWNEGLLPNNWSEL